jgi:uncharacterized low-complexity protein
MKYKLSPIASALSITLAATLAAAPIAQADQNPFGVSEMSDGYMLAGAEGQCGEGKCGGDMKKAKDKEGKHDNMEKDKEGKCGEMKEDKDKEGKCGEGKCGEKE